MHREQAQSWCMKRKVTFAFLFLFSSPQIKNRIGVMRYVVLHGRVWDDLYIGFQNRIARDPDVYHHKYANFIHCSCVVVHIMV